MTNTKLELLQELVDTCVELSSQSEWEALRLPIRNVQSKNTIPGALPKWLDLFEKITRSTGKVVHVPCSTKSVKAKVQGCLREGPHKIPYERNRLGSMLFDTLNNAWPFIWPYCEQPTLPNLTYQKTQPTYQTPTYKTAPQAQSVKPKLHYSPTLSLLFESAKERDLGQAITMTLSSRTDLIRACDIINGYVDQIRQQASSARHREKQKEFYRVPNENYRWLKALIDECFTGNEHLYFAYVDLGYKPKIDAKSAKFYAQAKANGQELRDRLDNGEKWPSTILGYGLNLRYLPYNGYHYRLLVICQPRENEPPTLITTTIENEWENVTAQTGVVFNHLFNARDRSLEKIAWQDDAARKELEKKLYFLTQLDSLIRLKLAPKDRHFFRGEKQG